MTQNEAILRRLQRGGILLPMEALNDPEIRTMKLATRIGELIREGNDIEKLDVLLESGKTVKGYQMRFVADSEGQGFLRMAV